MNDTAVLIILMTALTALGIFIAAFTALSYRKSKLKPRSAILLWCFSAALLLFAYSLTGHEHFMQFGLMHILLTLIVVMLPFVIRIFIPEKDLAPGRHKAAMYSLTAVILFFTLFKFSYIWKYDMSLYSVLPLNLCNIVAVFIAVRPFWRSERTDNYILCFGLLGGIFNLIIGMRYGYNQDFFTDIVYESNIVHNLYISYCIYALISGEIVPKIRTAVQNLYWLTPLFVVYIFTNQIWEFNFFFTGIYENPVLGIYELFPVFSSDIFGRVFEFNPLYYLFVIAAAALILCLLSWLLSLIAKKWEMPPRHLP